MDVWLISAIAFTSPNPATEAGEVNLPLLTIQRVGTPSLFSPYARDHDMLAETSKNLYWPQPPPIRVFSSSIASSSARLASRTVPG